VTDKKSSGPEVKGLCDPVDVLRAYLAKKATLRALFVESGLAQSEMEAIDYALKGARGLETAMSRKDRRALDLLLAGRPDWFECLLRDPAKASPSLRAALAEIAVSRS